MQPMREMEDGSLEAGKAEPLEVKRLEEMLGEPGVREVRVFKVKGNRKKIKKANASKRKRQQASRRKNR